MGKHATEYIFIVLCLVYGIFSIVVTQHILETSSTPYYNFLIDAFFHRRVNVILPIHYDLSSYHGKWYLNWAPAPILFILPFYFISGKYTSDIVYTLIAGMLNFFLFYLFLTQCVRYFSLKISTFSKLFILIGFAICSPNFYLSLSGQIWSTEQIIGVMYLLLAYTLFFYFLQIKSVFAYLLAIIFFSFAWLSRYTIFLSFFVFLYPFFLYKNYTKRQLFVLGGILGGVTILSVLFLFDYNYIKFGNIFETGLRYHIAAKRYDSVVKSGKFFSINYLPGNFFTYFLDFVTLSPRLPFLRIHSEGNSIMSLYPSWVFLLYLGKTARNLSNKIIIFLMLASLPIVLTLGVLLCYFASGWQQFGVRYVLDIAPLAYLLLLFVIERIPRRLLMYILIYELIINFYGIIVYFYFHT